MQLPKQLIEGMEMQYPDQIKTKPYHTVLFEGGGVKNNLFM